VLHRNIHFMEKNSIPIGIGRAGHLRYLHDTDGTDLAALCRPITSGDIGQPAKAGSTKRFHLP
jgi:hypothetical protein